MIVRYKQRIDVTNVSAMFGQPLLRRFAADARIYEQPNFIGFNIEAVSVTARLQRYRFHPFSLTTGRK